MSWRKDAVRKDYPVPAVWAGIAWGLIQITGGALSISAAILSHGIRGLFNVVAKSCLKGETKGFPASSAASNGWGGEAEDLMGIILPILMAIGALGMGYLSLTHLSGAIPGMLAFTLVLASFFSNSISYSWARLRAKRQGSSLLMARAWRLRKNWLCSAVALTGVAGNRAGLGLMDSAAAICICFVLLSEALAIAVSPTKEMSSRPADEDTLNKIGDITMSIRGVRQLNAINATLMGKALFVELEISTDGQMSPEENRTVSSRLNKILKCSDLSITQCMIKNKASS